MYKHDLSITARLLLWLQFVPAESPDNIVIVNAHFLGRAIFS
jgi:hypothetical protein